MTHEEAIAIKIYYEALAYADELEYELRYSSNDETEYYDETQMTMKLYNFIIDYYFDNDDIDRNLFYVNIICDYLDKLNDVHTDKIGVR